MVDFNNEATVGTPAVDVERISILQRRYDLIEAIEHYRKMRLNGAAMGISVVSCRLFSLFLELQACLARHLTPKEYDKLLDVCLNSSKEEEILTAVYKINSVLDQIKLTRIDTQRVYDSTDTEAENKIKGF